MTVFLGGYYKHDSIALSARQAEHILIKVYRKYKKDNRYFSFFVCDTKGNAIVAVHPETYNNIEAFKSCFMCCNYYRITFDSMYNYSIVPMSYEF